MALVSCDDVTGAFEDLGIDLDEPKVIDLLSSFCDLYKMDVDALSTEVMAFMYRRKMSATATPTMEVLDDFEREVLRKREDKRKADMARGIVDVTNLIASSAQPLDEDGDNDEEDELLSAYGAKGDGNKRRQQGTPEANKNRNKILATDAGGVPFSPASFKPPNAITPGSRKYNSRANAGTVIIKYGDLASVPSWKLTEKDTAVTRVRLEETSLTRDYRYMFESLQNKAGKLDEIICRMGEKLRLKLGGADDDNNDADDDAVDFTRPSTDPMVCLGRVCSDSFDGKINAKSILLQGSQDTCEGKCVSLQPSRVDEYSLFPGQIVKAVATNPKGSQLLASKLVCDASPTLPTKQDKITAGQPPLSVVAAAGPYTTSDNLAYEPLADLLKYLLSHRPHLAILTGPFVDYKHDLISSGTTDEFFQDTFKRVMSMITEVAKGIPGTQFVVVSSTRDVHHFDVYPTPPFPSEDLPDNVTMAADPSCFTVEGVLFGITATDVLFHLGREEISAPPRSGDRLRRLSNHLLQQRSFYPLYPPSDEVNIDYEKFEAHCLINIQPHVLILPSDFLHFYKDINGGLVLNPTRLAKRETGGSFARFFVNPPDKEGQSFAHRVIGEIMRI